MTPAALLSALHRIPRDTTVVIEGNVRLAEALRSRGFHSVLVGAESAKVPSVPTADVLNDMWSVLSCRTGQAVCIASDTTMEAVTRACERTRVNLATSGHRSRGWAQNILRNFHHLAKPTAMQADGLRGVPAFIVGAGSSLDLNHALLPEASRRGIVIAVNAAARLPGVDMALTIESNDLRYKLGPLGHVGIRSFAMVGDPAMLDHGSGALLPVYAGELGNLLASITGVERLASSAHGGTAAVSLAERLGCSPIVLVGQDFAGRDGGRVYPECLGLGDTRMRIDGDWWVYEWPEALRSQPRHNPLNEREPVVWVPGLDGHPVPSSMALAGTRQWLESVGRQDLPARLVNASEWGATIQGWEPAKLADVIAGLPEIDYAVSAGDGVPLERLREWLQAHIDAVEGLWPWDPREFFRHLRTAPLLEPWCQAAVAEVMATRRAAPMGNPFAELRQSERDWRAVTAVVAEQSAGLLLELQEALKRCS